MDIIFKNKIDNRHFFEIDKGNLPYVVLNYHNVDYNFKILLSTQKYGLNKKLYDNEFYVDIFGNGETEILLGFSIFSKHKFIKKFKLS